MAFNQDCYDLLTKIPKGRVTTYKEIAIKLGKKSYRAVGNAMNSNPNAPKVPCHRVVKSNGEIGGYAFGVNKKITLLKEENIEVSEGKIQNFAEKIYKF